MKGPSSAARRLRVGCIAIPLVVAAACAAPDDRDAGAAEAHGGDSCARANHEATLSFLAQDLAEAFARLGDAVELCAEDPTTRFRSLSMVADIARASHEFCSGARALRDAAKSVSSVDYLRASTRIDHACGAVSPAEVGLSALAQAAASATYGANTPLMVEFVRLSELAQLEHWSSEGQPSAEALRAATRALCSANEVLTTMVGAIGSARTGPDHPAAVLGLWTLQPVEAIDDDARRCLERIAGELEQAAPGFPSDPGRDAEQLIAWIRTLER